MMHHAFALLGLGLGKPTLSVDPMSNVKLDQSVFAMQRV